MRKRTLSSTFIKGLRAAPRGQRAEHWDTNVQGFGVRVTDKGAKSFILYTRYPPSNTPARRTLGDADKMNLAAARHKAREWLDMIQQGKDPQEVAQQAALAALRAKRTTFAMVAEAWLADVARRRQRKGHEVAQDVRREFVPRWGNRPITEITQADITKMVNETKDRPAQARNLLGYAKRLFGWALDQQEYGLETNPAAAARPNKLIGKKVIRQRVLDDHELRALWHAAAKLGYPYGPLFHMLALTGQRRNEVAEARWREFDLAKKLWVIPPERMKGNRTHVVPLTDEVLALLDGLPRFTKGDFVFSTMYGAKPVGGFSGAKRRLDKQLAGAVEHFTIHDIRRTVRTRLSAIKGISSLVCEAVIAHARPGLHQVYDQHSYEDQKREALQLWAAALRAIVDPPPSNVVPLRQTGAT